MNDIRDAYGYTPEEWMRLKDNPHFLADLAAAVQMVKKEGASFQLKRRRLQAEELLKTSWRLIHAPADEVPKLERQGRSHQGDRALGGLR
jgi:hypothetical protein